MVHDKDTVQLSSKITFESIGNASGMHMECAKPCDEAAARL